MTNEDFLTMLQPLMTRALIHEAVIRSLVSLNPDPAEIRRRAESVLMQAQGILAASGRPLPALGVEVAAILDSLFQPAIVLPPDAE